MFLHESAQAIRFFDRARDWGQVRQRLIDEQVVSYTTLSSATRLSREIILRLQSLHGNEIEFLQNADFEERRAVCWIAICRTYDVIPDFVRSVLTDRLLSLRNDLSAQDFTGFLDDQAMLHDEVARLTTSTRIKLRTCLYRMLADARFYDQKTGLQKAPLPLTVRRLIDANSPREVSFFPGHEL
jgi:hypothetical protein